MQVADELLWCNRERLKIFNSALSVMNKCFPSVPSRKRSRSDLVCTERSNSIFPTDRAVLGSGMGKMGTQIHAIGSGFELDPQKSEERTKIAIPNKRTRTSMLDVRVCNLNWFYNHVAPWFMFVIAFFFFWGGGNFRLYSIWLIPV